MAGYGNAKEVTETNEAEDEGFDFDDETVFLGMGAMSKLTLTPIDESQLKLPVERDDFGQVDGSS